MDWRTLRKGRTSVCIAYAGTFTNNLGIYNAQVRVHPSVEFSIDLSPNLKSPAKSANTYADAKLLADGQIDRLEYVQIDDQRIVEGLRDALDNHPKDWMVSIELERTHSFSARPRLENGSLFLYVVPKLK